MFRPDQHISDKPEMCWFCKNFYLIPTGGAGIFKCMNKNTPDQVKLCSNYEERENPEFEYSYEIRSK